MDYALFHDESKIGGYWHGLIFIPEERLGSVIFALKEIRRAAQVGESNDVSFKNVRGNGKNFQAVRMTLDLFKSLLRSNPKTTDYIYLLERKYSREEGRHCGEYKKVISISEPHYVKFVLLKERDNHGRMEFGDYGARVETTFRFALKGGCHFMFDENRPINIKTITFDGHQHHRRNIDQSRILRNLHDEFRNYATIDENFSLDDRQLSNRADDTFLLMNLIDNVTSAWRSLISNTGNEFQKKAALSLMDLADRAMMNKILVNIRGRWHRSFYLSECYLEDDQWCFRDIYEGMRGKQLPLF